MGALPCFAQEPTNSDRIAPTPRTMTSKRRGEEGTTQMGVRTEQRSNALSEREPAAHLLLSLSGGTRHGSKGVLWVTKPLNAFDEAKSTTHHRRGCRASRRLPAERKCWGQDRIQGS